jgi:hypothetical protein
MAMSERNIFYLHELSDYKVASEDPDVRGWKVQDAQGRQIGTVDNLLVNKSLKRVVYLDVELDEEIIKADNTSASIPAHEGIHGFVNKEGEDHLIVPIGMVTLFDDEKIVKSQEISYDTFRSSKRISKGTRIDPGYEIIIYHQLMSEPVPEERTINDSDFYNKPQFKR